MGVYAWMCSLFEKWRKGRMEAKRVAELTTQLIDLITEANEWGVVNGWPTFEKYPQCQQIEAIGQELNDIGGIDLMRRVYSRVEATVPYPGMSQWWWDGIGTWQA